MNTTQLAQDLKKGCGENMPKEFEDLGKCDDMNLCPTCQAKISQMQTDLKNEIDFLEDKRIMLDTSEFNDNDVGIVREEIKERIAELKSALEVLG